MLSDLFNAKDGAFAENIRSTLNDDLTELVASLKEHGWVPEFPALIDENGVVLVGHRRMKAAEIAGIEPVVKTLSLGHGDAADAERLRLAIVSNIGAKPLTKEDRQRIAQHLYGSREWTMERIAEALNVSKKTISLDLDQIVPQGNNSPHPKTPSNPKGAGRPKGTKQPRTTIAGESEITRKVRDYVRPMVESGEPLSVKDVAKATGHSRIISEAAIAYERGRLEGLSEADQEATTSAPRPRVGAPKTELARPAIRDMLERGEPVDRMALKKELGLTEQPLKAAEAYERGRLEGIAEANRYGPANPSELLSKTAQGKLAVFERRLRAEMEADFDRRVREEVKRRLAERDARDDEVIAQANELILHSSGRQRPPFNPQEYYQLLWALHPDCNDPAKATAAFIMVRQKKLILCEEGAIKRKSDDAQPLPTLEEMLARRKVRA